MLAWGLQIGKAGVYNRKECVMANDEPAGKRASKPIKDQRERRGSKTTGAPKRKGNLKFSLFPTMKRKQP